MLKVTLSLIIISTLVQIAQCSQKLQFDGIEYTLVRKDKAIKIASNDVDPLLRQMYKTQLRDFQTRYTVSSKKLSDGSRVVRPNFKLNGGGWLSGIISYVAIKAVTSPLYMIPAGVAYSAAVEAVAQSVSAAAANNPNLP